MRRHRSRFLAIVLVLYGQAAFAQQRPLVTEDPETIGAGRMLVESGFDLAHDQQYPASGLTGNLLSIPTLGLSFGISSIAELQLDGSLHNRLHVTDRNPNAALASSLTFTGDDTHDFGDAVIATKIRFASEGATRPAMGIRFATKLPNASNESGLGTDTTDFYATLLVGKTVQSVRVVGNIGLGILPDPVVGNRQNDVLAYGLSFARAMTQAAELVGEVNGRASTTSGTAYPGTESRSILKLGGRFTTGTLRLDAGVFFGLTTLDPTIGATFGFTYVFNAFSVP